MPMILNNYSQFNYKRSIKYKKYLSSTLISEDPPKIFKYTVYLSFNLCKEQVQPSESSTCSSPEWFEDNRAHLRINEDKVYI